MRREIVAAEFRDRIVHHLYYSYTHQLFERTFIEDAYSCIEGRGTHYGVKRLQQHIREESQNYTRPCYVLKMDIRGYFMGIDRKRLLELCRATLQKNMAAIHSKDTKPEMIVRRGLWKRGFRYRLNSPKLPGHPDLVLRKYRTCIFVNGCFWHGHNVALPQMNSEERIVNSECCKIPKTNRAFWVAKIRRNKERDKEDQKKLAAMGWHCITVWECELKPSKREETLESIAFTLNHIWLQDHQAKTVPYPEFEEEDIQIPMAAEERTEKEQ